MPSKRTVGDVRKAAAKASPKKLTVESFAGYLALGHFSLFGRSFDVSHPEGRRIAAEWFIHQYESWKAT